MIKCQNCGEELPDNAKFCGKCGTALMPDKNICKACGAELPDNAKFCGKCGTAAGSNTKTPQGRPEHAQPFAPHFAETVKKNFKSKPAFWIAVAVASVVLIIIIISSLSGTTSQQYIYKPGVSASKEPCRICNGARQITCDYCKGSGSADMFSLCPACGGLGNVICFGCQGTGLFLTPEEWNSRSQSGGGGSPNNSPSNILPSSGGGGIDLVNMTKNYQDMGKIVEKALQNYRNAVSEEESIREHDRLYNIVISEQRRMKSYREECNSKGAKIGAGYYETARP